MTYATRQDLIDRDESMLWNLALNAETNALDETTIEQALQQASDEIDSLLARRFQLPLPTVPGVINKMAVQIAIYWLADNDNQVTDLIEKRYQQAIATIKEIVAGTRELGLPTETATPEAASGKVTLIQSESGRLMTREKLSGVL